MLFERLLVCEQCTAGSAPLNMATDEALLERSTQPVLRFYCWRNPSLSFGYFGKFSEAIDQACGRELVRRWTGGGSVAHGEDLTYSLIIPSTSPASGQGSTAIYRASHRAIRDGLRREGKDAELTEFSRMRISDACFANPVQYDVMLGGHKVAGAAQRRTRQGLLQQGSIQVSGLDGVFRQRFAGLLAEQLEPIELPASVARRADFLVENKYGTEEWLRRW